MEDLFDDFRPIMPSTEKKTSKRSKDDNSSQDPDAKKPRKPGRPRKSAEKTQPKEGTAIETVRFFGN